MQVKLLRALQEKRFTPVGSNQEGQADIRIIAATNRPLEEMIEDGSFRSDLFYRLNVLPINLPPLRDRREDIEELTKYMINKFNEVHSRSISSISKEALNALRMYSWPGNIRELENVIEHAFIIESTDKIQLTALPENVLNPRQGASSKESNTTSADSLQDLVTDFSELKYPVLKEKFEKEFIIRALKAFNGKINQTAEHTQMTKVTLLRKLEKYSINPKEFTQR
jgi:transcriptional regulator with PAS, ATPase and Fis domain